MTLSQFKNKYRLNEHDLSLLMLHILTMGPGDTLITPTGRLVKHENTPEHVFEVKVDAQVIEHLLNVL